MSENIIDLDKKKKEKKKEEEKPTSCTKDEMCDECFEEMKQNFDNYNAREFLFNYAYSGSIEMLDKSNLTLLEIISTLEDVKMELYREHILAVVDEKLEGKDDEEE